ncbi:MAG: glycoside hydrolase family 3 N-terminal domain-containing protein [Crocinitomicaceae bacterium]
MNKHIFIILFFLSISQLVISQRTSEDQAVWKKAQKLTSCLTTDQKIAQTCQVTLDALLKTDASGQVIKPIEIDPKKCEKLIEQQQIGSVLNVSSHTLDRATWNNLLNTIHSAYKNGKTVAPVLYGVDAIHGANYVVGGTLFTQEIGLAETWNPSLANKMGEITAYETRASGVPWNFSQVLDLGRQPLWSRFFETLGEDPLLASEMGAELVKGYQGANPAESTRVAACMKHFVGYSLPRSGRDRTPAWIPERLMHELYLPSFKAAVDAGALTVMINSGDVNGTPGHINKYLITDLLKNKWGFKGLAVSDWEDIRMLHTVHKVATSQKEAIIMAINAGLDMSMVPYNGPHEEYLNLFKEAVSEKKISMKRLNDAVTRIIYVKLKLGLYEKQLTPWNEYPKFGSEEFKNAAKDAALESITILKNENELLPLKKSEKILLVGEAADNLIFHNGAWTHTWQGEDTSFNTKGAMTFRVSLQKELGQNLMFDKGYDLTSVNGWETCQIENKEKVLQNASQADKIIICLGEMPATEKPGDVKSLNLCEEQQELVKALQETGKPVILVLLFGKPHIIREIEPKSAAIVHAYLPGDSGGDALTEILVGKENPSGKLPYTYPKYDGVIEYYDYVTSESKTNKLDAKPIDPQWPFGFGLSYTSYSYSNLKIENQGDGKFKASIDVKNTGPKAGKEVVQWYITDEYASITPANKKLKHFEKISLEPGQSKNLVFTIDSKDLQFVNSTNQWTTEPGEFTLKVGDQSVGFLLK